MKTLLSREHFRHLKLIEWLYKTSEPVSLARLSDLLNYSHRTLARDTKYINLMYAPIEIKATAKGNQLHFPPTISLDFVISRTLALNLAHSFLEAIFFNPDYTSEELATHLFISLSSLKRLIKDIQQKLAPLDIQLNSRPYHLTGKEEHIQQLYLCLFKNKYPNCRELLSSEQLILSQELLAHLLPFFQKQAISPLLNNFFYLLLISVTRQVPTPFLSHEQDIITYLLSLSEESPDFPSSFETTYNLPFDQVFAKRLLFNLKACETAVLETGLFDITTKVSPYQQQLNQLLTAIEETFKLTFRDHPSLVHDLEHLLLIQAHSTFLSPLPKPPVNIALTLTDEAFHYFCLFLSTALKQPQLTDLKDYHDNLLHIFEMYWPYLTVTITERLAPLKIGLLSSYCLLESHLLKERLTVLLGPHYSVTIIDEWFSDSLPFETFDVLISPYSRPDVTDPNLICLNVSPDSQEWQRLAKLLFTLNREKNMTSAPFFDTMVGE